MFSIKQKQHIAAEVEKLLLSINHPEMPTDKPDFQLLVAGKESWSFSVIKPNHTVTQDDIADANPWNEMQDKQSQP